MDYYKIRVIIEDGLAYPCFSTSEPSSIVLAFNEYDAEDLADGCSINVKARLKLLSSYTYLN